MGRSLSRLPDAYGSAGEVIAALTSRPLDDPWVREVVAALGRDREWATRWRAGTGRLRQHLEIVRGRGKRVHATAAANRESIDRHGLDWNRMGLAPGLAGDTRPELPAIFVCEDLDDVSFLLRIARVPTDIWSVDVDGIWLENAPNGWQVISLNRAFRSERQGWTSRCGATFSQRSRRFWSGRCGGCNPLSQRQVGSRPATTKSVR